MPQTIIGVMGPGESATERECEVARELGRLVAEQGWTLLTGGRSHGVMHAAAEGARSAGGLTVGILPSREAEDVSPAIEIPVFTGMGEARNVVNVLTSTVVLVVGMSSGTASEVALAIKVGRPVVLVGMEAEPAAFFRSLDPSIYSAADPVEAVQIVKRILEG